MTAVLKATRNRVRIVLGQIDDKRKSFLPSNPVHDSLNKLLMEWFEELVDLEDQLFNIPRSTLPRHITPIPNPLLTHTLSSTSAHFLPIQTSHHRPTQPHS
ncbi:hypothetical protein Pmani_032117 [Petrolisthes manimaculis]|uniref:Uncharacterized protein n=1 Tax=Petrolisthes manimaculis TaxID=1843537 RepID=A0AAE1NSB7_9EUCA|nr:hypothetical protein Pmani_032117 [Petrolisthes manimaculis]